MQAQFEDVTVTDLRPTNAKPKHTPPFPIYWNEQQQKSIPAYNRYSGESVNLTPEAYAVFEITMASYNTAMAEGRDNPSHWGWKKYHQGAAWFQKHYPHEYMVILD